jgi:hypothetical protein
MSPSTAEADTPADARRKRPARRGTADAAADHQPAQAQVPQPASDPSSSGWPDTVANPRRIRVR